MWLTQLALHRPVTISMLFVCAVTLGLAATRLLPLEFMPSVQFPGVFVQVDYPGSTPEENERNITRILEDALATVSNIDTMRSVSSSNQVRIDLMFGWDVDAKVKGVEIREKIDAIRGDLPSDLRRVNVFTGSTSDQPLLQARISSTGDLASAWETLDRQLIQRIERIPGVSRVDIQGLAERTYQVTLDPEKLQAYRVDTNALLSRLQASNVMISAGELRGDNQNLRVTVNEQFQDMNDIAGFVVNSAGITLGDIAAVNLAQTEVSFGRRVDGAPAVGLNITKEASANLVETADLVEAELAALAQLPAFQGISIQISENSADGVRQSLSDVASSGLIGFMLSTLVLFLFLRDIRLTLIVSTAVPFSLTITLAALYLLNISLNILSLMGLMLAIGMLVDNAVVISESIFRQQEKMPDEPHKAVAMGVQAVGIPVVAGTLTTAIVFLPNIIGEKIDMTIFLSHVAVTIVVSLLASLFISTTMIPLLLSRVRPKTALNSAGRGRMLATYRRVLQTLLDRPALGAALVILMLASVYIPLQLVSADQTMGGEDSQLRIYYNLEGSYELSRVEQLVVQIEDFLQSNKQNLDIESMQSFYNRSTAQTSLQLLPAEQRQFTDAQIRQFIEENMPRSAIARPGFDRSGSAGGGSGFDVRLLGNDSQTLVALANELILPLQEIEGVSQVVSEIQRGSQEVRILLDSQRLQQLGLDAEQLARTISTGLRQQQLRTFRNAAGEVDITVSMFQVTNPAVMSDLMALPIALPDGRQLRLDAMAEFEIAQALPDIRRTDRRSGLGLRLEYANEEISSQQLRAEVTALMARYEERFPEGVSWNFGEGVRNFDRSLNQMLINMLLAIMMIFIVMAALFESLLFPLAVVSSIVYGIVGVFWFFLLTGTSITVMALIGILVLIGVVVNNGIVLVDRINYYRQTGMPRNAAVVEAASDRIRPILMTAGTTVFGLLPLSLGDTSIGGMGPPYFPMARAVIGGMLFSTIAALSCLPVIYVFLDWMRDFYGRLWVSAVAKPWTQAASSSKRS
ncbi:MAG: efflux RND transporter permease subunit [Pseudomonadales bacterium]|nr:efflux RND transporter permease subunit [Pseudomonadales bacterium]